MTMIDHSNPNYRLDDEWRALIRAKQDFPQPGILFQDVTPMLGNADAFDCAIGTMCEGYEDENIDQVVGLDARGFIFGGAMATELSCGFTPVRKRGKLPGSVHVVAYALEYGTAAFELPCGSVTDKRVLVVDDLLATGGSAAAACKLVQQDGGTVVGVVFMIELVKLGGRAALHKVVPEADIFSVLTY
jgi:adenine phosphoribosyltransferase